MFLLLGPAGKAPQYHEIGRSIATLMTDEVIKSNVFELDSKYTVIVHSLIVKLIKLPLMSLLFYFIFTLPRHAFFEAVRPTAQE